LAEKISDGRFSGKIKVERENEEAKKQNSDF
jgi:hypothetical protein